MKLTTFIGLGLFIVWVVLAIVDIWFDVVSWGTFVKITVTVLLLGVLALTLRILGRNMQD